MKKLLISTLLGSIFLLSADGSFHSRVITINSKDMVIQEAPSAEQPKASWNSRIKTFYTDHKKTCLGAAALLLTAMGISGGFILFKVAKKRGWTNLTPKDAGNPSSKNHH